MSFRQKRKYPFRLVYQLMAVLLIMSVGPLLLSSRELLQINQLALEDGILNLHTQAASRLKGSVELFLKNAEKSLLDLARLQGMTDVLDQAQRQSLLVSFIGNSDQVAGIKIFGPDGAEQMSATRDRALEEAFRATAAMRKGQLDAGGGDYRVAQPLTVAGFDSVLLPVLVQIKSARGETVGALAAMMDLGELQQMVAEARVGHGGGAFLVDRTGRVIAHHDPAKARERADMSRVEIVSGYVLGGGRTGGTIPFTGEDGREMLGSYDLVQGVGWGVVIEEPKQEAYLSLQLMKKQTTIWVVLVVLAAVILAALSSHRISRPIRIFASRALAVAKGDFHGSIEVKSRNEIGQMAETFNFMIRELDKYDRNMRELFLSTIKSLAAAVDAKDPYTRGHSERVTQYALAMARAMGKEGRELEDIQIGALLHDVGKIGIDDSILRKPGRLTEEEFAIMKMHPVFGANIMAPIRQLREIIPGMKYHHEHVNGSGYPEGLKGEEIPLMARIISVADTFDAMTSERPYQKAMDDTAAMRMLVRLGGIRYDPEAVSALAAAHSTLGRPALGDIGMAPAATVAYPEA